MIKKNTHAGNMELLGGRLCLDFTNTADWHGSEAPIEFLNRYEDLMTWCSHVKIMSDSEANLLLKKKKQAPEQGYNILEKSILLREALFRIFLSIANKGQPKEEDIILFNQNLSQTVQLLTLTRKKDQYSWDLHLDRTRLDWFLHPIIYSAAELLASPDIKKVKTCGDISCGWLFLDVSRNQSRRWCNMKDCGNRAKANRFYQKSKQM